MSDLAVQRVSMVRLTVAVLVGVLAAAAIIFAVWQANQPSDFDCAIQRGNYELGKLEAWEVDQTCR